MIVRIYWGKVAPGAWPMLEQKYRDLAAHKIPGMLGRLVTQDVNDSESMFTITFWSDLDSVRRWERSNDYKELFLAPIKPYLVGSHSVSLCDVRVGRLGDLPQAT